MDAPFARSKWLSLVVLPFIIWCGKLKAQECLPEGITFSTQAQMDAFATDYPDCTTILGDVIIEETSSGNITSLKGLSGITAFGDYLEIHENTALTDLSGLEQVSNIWGGLNIYGNPGLETLKGLEGLQSVHGSLRVALNHNLRNIQALSALQSVDEDVTISDNLILNSLFGLQSLDTIGGYLLITTSHELINLQGLNALRAVGKGLLIEDNSQLRDLRGMDGVTSIGGNCIIVNNLQLNTLDGLNALTAVGGKLQIALNPRLETVTALRKLQQMNGLLQIYANSSLRNLSGLENIDAAGIEDLAILSSNVLTNCSVKSICDYLRESSNQSSISMNGSGCNYRAQVLERCQRKAPPAKPEEMTEPVFYPNPTSSLVTLEAEAFENAEYEVQSALGRTLLTGTLENRQFDLSELPAGLYYVKIRSEAGDLLQKIVKVN